MVTKKKERSREVVLNLSSLHTSDVMYCFCFLQVFHEEDDGAKNYENIRTSTV